MSMLVFISGPLTALGTDQFVNVRTAALAWHKIRDAGFFPILPHALAVVQLVKPRSYEDYMAYDLFLLSKCNAMVRLEGESPGGEREVAFAREHGVPVYNGVDSFLAANAPQVMRCGECSKAHTTLTWNGAAWICADCSADDSDTRPWVLTRGEPANECA